MYLCYAKFYIRKINRIFYVVKTTIYLKSFSQYLVKNKEKGDLAVILVDISFGPKLKFI